MHHHALRKYRGPETWARIRERYLAGEPGPALAREFDVGLANLRRRAATEGWTRGAHARFHDEPNVRWAPETPGERAQAADHRRFMTLHAFQTRWPEIWDEMVAIAGEAARCALTDTPEDAGPLSDWAYRWRADHFGPQCAAEDERRRAERAEGYASAS